MHSIVRFPLIALAAPLLLTGLAIPAAAQTDARISGFFTLGALSTPEYQGSSDRIISPLVAARLAYGSNYIETATLSAGLGLRANVSPWPEIEFGPFLGQRRGRSDVENERVRLLEDIDDSFEAGVFVRVPFRNVLDSRDEAAIEVQFQGDVSWTASGNLLFFGGSYRFNPTDRLRLSALALATYASDRYNQTFFGVTAAGAAASGLPEYKASSGIRDVGLTFTANYEITGGWGITGVVNYRRLLGDAADSPIVSGEGNANQLSFGLGISYRF
ncbi:MipA/OmpV family protein [Roseomonas rosulenta]|uniref:MipA/OmpV family protein n=1 Tax=Roseomonas rosulenta TaxID=2748667 RepID=UPI0018DF110E|nr:MipA/OmpV family protein [Roseomonas rosulenta]